MFFTSEHFHQVATLLQIHGLRAYIYGCAASIIMGKLFLHFFTPYLQSKVRKDLPETHNHKNYTPTMGGIFMIISVLMIWPLLGISYTTEIILLTLSLIVYACIGFYDDWCKIHKTEGIKSLTKFTLQTIAATSLLYIWITYSNPSLVLYIPFICTIPIKYLFIPWGAFIIIGTSNAVNLTDGLDGLATQSLIPNFLLAAVFATTSVQFYPLITFSLLITGILYGFLYYNRRPAKMFMGDVGSLPLGATLAFLFIMLNHEWILALSGIIFVAETLSVMLQLTSVKLYKKRIFKMAPFHHHLELCGWSEQKIVFVLSSITTVTCLAIAAFYSMTQNHL